MLEIQRKDSSLSKGSERSVTNPVPEVVQGTPGGGSKFSLGVVRELSQKREYLH